MRVRVALPIAKPLHRGSYIAGPDGERTWIQFKYERLLVFYHFCGLLGHDLRHCASHYAAEKNGGVGKYLYGDWLKAVGNRSKPSCNHDSESHDEPDNATVKEQHPTGVEAAAINVLPENSLVKSVTKIIENGSNHEGSPKR